MAQTNLSIREISHPPEATFKVTPDSSNTELLLQYSVKNTTGEPIFVFRANPPFIRLDSAGHVTFMSLMPELTPWSFPIMPYIPPVVRLEVGEVMLGEARYKLPLRDTHPYPAGPVTVVPIPTREDLSKKIGLTIGYFPEKDGNTLFDGIKPGEKIPSYYELRRQFWAEAKPQILSVPIHRPL